jgi:hypothetical protein
MQRMVPQYSLRTWKRVGSGRKFPMFQSQEWPRKKGLALGTQDRYHRMNKIQYQASIWNPGQAQVEHQRGRGANERPTAVGKDDFKFNRRHGAGTLNSASREDDVAGRHQNPVSTKITEDLAAARV